MNSYKQDLIAYRIERAEAMLQTAKNLIEDKDWFSAVNRLYYAVYQIMSALMTKEDITIRSHSGAKAMFELHFVKTGRVDSKWSKLYSRLSDARHNSDYGAFTTFSQEDVLPLLPETEMLVSIIKNIINED